MEKINCGCTECKCKKESFRLERLEGVYVLQKVNSRGDDGTIGLFTEKEMAALRTLFNSMTGDFTKSIEII